MNATPRDLKLSTVLTLVTLAHVAPFAAHADDSLLAPSFLPIEREIDTVVSTWPETSEAFEHTWESVTALLDKVRKEYAPRVNGYHPIPPEKPAKDRTPQELARRGGRIVPRNGVSPIPRIGTPSPPPTGATKLPHHPRYYGIHCLTPIPGKPDTWTDILMLNDDAHRVHAARFDERNVLRELSLITWEGISWRAMEITLYPDGAPARLRFWQDGAPAHFRCDWTPKGDRTIVVVRDGQYEGEAPVSVCAVTVSYLPPGTPDDGTALERSPFPMPVAALHLIPTGETGTIEAPFIEGYDLAGWSDEGSGASPQLTVRPQGPVQIVAHYVWNTRVEGGRLFIPAGIEEAVRRLPNGPASINTNYELLDVVDLDLSASRVDELYTLSHFKRLQRVDLSKSPVNDLFPLSTFAAIERALSGPTSPMQTDLFNRVLLALNAGIAPPIDTLLLEDTDLSGAYGLEFLQNLKHLNVRKAELGDLWFVGHLDSLESLDAAQNDITGIAPLEFIGPRLRSINLERNQVTDLTLMARRTAWPAGMELALGGNDLNADALCTVIPALEASGVSVSFDGKCENQSARISEEDADGDGYTNREEWQFVSLFSALEPEREAQFTAAISDATIPLSYLENLPESASGKKVAIDAIPTTNIQIIITGKGSVYPGNGSHEFADKVFKDDGTWDWSSITVRPAAAPGWELVPFDEFFFDGDVFKREANGTGIILSMQTSVALQFEFREARTPLAVDLVDALKTFVEKYYPGQDPFTFDGNDLDYKDKVEYPAPNGMPDAAELRLIQAILQTPDYDEYGKLGTSFDEAMELWNANLPIAERALGDAGVAEPYLVHLLTAYATMGGYQDRGAIVAMIQQHKGLVIDSGQFEQGLYDKLDPDETIHNGATFNKNIWKTVSEGRKIDRKVVDAYAAAVMAQPSR